MNKEDRYLKFLTEHPTKIPFSEQKLEILERREKTHLRRLERLKQVARLKFQEFKTLEEIADMMGVSRERVRQYLLPLSPVKGEWFDGITMDEKTEAILLDQKPNGPTQLHNEN